MNTTFGLGSNAPHLDRLNYFYGQMLGAGDLRTEQAFFREKIKLLNRCLHGYGTVCGLAVGPSPAPQDPCPPAPDDPPPAGPWLVIGTGMALDCEGNEIVIRHPQIVDLWHTLPAAERDRSDPAGQRVYVSLCYAEQAIEPVRPVLPDACGTMPGTVHGKLRDSFRVRVSIDPPADDRRCGTCCEGCGDRGVLLACIDDVRQGQPLADDRIRNNVRRMAGRFETARIASINWVHGGRYAQMQAWQLVQDGIEVHFSAPVRTDSITPGVVDVWVVTGGSDQSGTIWRKSGTISFADPAAEFNTGFRYSMSGDALNPDDRVLITLRTSFILDRCCRPVDGMHMGRIPTIAGSPTPALDPIDPPSGCVTPPHQFGAWTSGSPFGPNTFGGGNFESWFYIG